MWSLKSVSDLTVVIYIYLLHSLVWKSKLFQFSPILKSRYAPKLCSNVRQPVYVLNDTEIEQNKNKLSEWGLAYCQPECQRKPSDRHFYMQQVVHCPTLAFLQLFTWLKIPARSTTQNNVNHAKNVLALSSKNQHCLEQVA